MISWTKINENYWIWRYKDKVKKLNSIRELVLHNLAMEVDLDESEFALLEMSRNEHNYCEFGIWKTFIYSEKI